MKLNIQHIVYLLPLLALAPFCGLQAQAQLRVFNSCTTSSNYRLLQGDTIIIQCDSVVLLNKRNFNVYESAYRQYRERNPNTRDLVKSYEALITEQDTMISNGKRDYDALRLKFDTLYFSSLANLNQTSQDIVLVKDNLANVSNHITQTQVLVGNAIEDIKTERRKSFLNKLTWGLGGLGIGVSVTAILMAVK